jgi:hypothetical protein
MQDYMLVKRDAFDASSSSAVPLPPSSTNALSHLNLLRSILSERRSRRGGRSNRKNVSSSRSFDPRGEYPSRRQLSFRETSVQYTVEGTLSNWLVSSNTVTNYVAGAFNLNSVQQQVVNLRSAFDQYRFDLIEVWIVPRTPGNTADVSRIGSCVDLDDSVTPTTVFEVESRPQSVVTGGLSAHYHKWKPMMAVDTNSSDSVTVEPMFIDTSDPNVNHFGIKAFAGVGTQALGYDLIYRFGLTFRGIGLA